jgi:glycosyltransferase involved in cell wall biosynthesis
VRVVWAVYGDVNQPTGGYVYDRLVIEALRARGDRVALVDPREGALSSPDADVVVGDGLCIPELGPAFEALAGGPARVLLVHHMPSWEIERADRGGSCEARAIRATEARAIRASDRIVATSAATRARLLEEGAAAPVDVVAPGADRLPRLVRPAPASRLLFVGSLVRRKRLELLLDALEALPAPRPVLTIAGDPDREPDYARSLLARIERGPLRACVRALGVVGDRALAEELAAADALVLPSSLEGYGMVLTEALHAGTPLIAARGAAEAAGVAGLDAARVFDDGPALAALLARFAADEGLRASMRRAAADLAPRSRQWSGAAREFRDVLERARRP